ncbi:MAG: hypothetical protein E6344_08440 [Clostridium sp.]|nr:hypothetical protein [Clostridium sp.]MDU7083710.1 hypothetical protein [Clostridium sp.]
MEIREISKSQLLKNVTIAERDRCLHISNLNDNDKPIEVEVINGEYYIVEGLDRLLNAHLSTSGDDKIKCHIYSMNE